MKVSSDEFQKNFGRLLDAALTELVTVTHDGHDGVVMISVEEYRRLKRRDRQVRGLTDFTDADVAPIKAVQPPSEASQFDDELE